MKTNGIPKLPTINSALAYQTSVNISANDMLTCSRRNIGHDKVVTILMSEALSMETCHIHKNVRLAHTSQQNNPHAYFP